MESQSQMPSGRMMKTMNSIMPSAMKSFSPLLITMKDFPLYKIGYDLFLMLRKSAYLIFLFGGSRMTGMEETDELYFNWSGSNGQMKATMWNAFSLVVLLTMTIISSFVLASYGIVMSILPFWALIPLTIWFSPIVIWSMWPPAILPGTGDNSKFREEKWFYINGIAINGWWYSQLQRKLQSLFGRPIHMIENKTFGIICDLLSIVIFRNIQYPTNTFLLTYNAIKAALMDDNNKRVVLLAHSEGAIIAQMVVDRLLLEMSNNELAKLEVFTFGSAADKFQDGHGKIPVIEHFANWYDYIAQTGVLHHKMMENVTNYAGTLYISDLFGHWFNQHYSRAISEKAFKSKEGKIARLYSYIGGGFPPDQSH